MFDLGFNMQEYCAVSGKDIKQQADINPSRHFLLLQNTRQVSPCSSLYLITHTILRIKDKCLGSSMIYRSIEYNQTLTICKEIKEDALRNSVALNRNHYLCFL